MSDDIWIKHNLGTFQQPYIFQQNRNRQSPTIAQKVAQTPAIARQPSTYVKQSPYSFRAPVSYQEPNIRNAQSPYIANGQSPYIANAQNPFIRSGQTPFTYNFRSPGTYRNPVSYQIPFTYNHRSPGTYRNPVSYQVPFTYNFRSPGTYRNPVNSQTPFTYNVQTSVPYSYRSPFSYNIPYSYRTPYIYTDEQQEDGNVNRYETSAASFDSSADSSFTLKVYRNANGTPHDIVVEGILNADGEDAFKLYRRRDDNTEIISNVYSETDGVPDTGYTSSDDPSLNVHTIEDVLVAGYTVRYFVFYSGDQATSGTLSGHQTLTTSAQTILYATNNSNKRARRWSIAAFNDTKVGRVTGTLYFEKSGSTTYTLPFQWDFDVESEEDDCPQCCIHESMLVSTPEGDKHINDIEVGEFIYGYNFETQQREETRTTRIKKLERDRIVKINDTIVTDDHPIYLADGTLTSTNPEATLKNYHQEVSRLEIGQHMIDVNGNVVEVKSIEPYEGTHSVYAIKTDLENLYADELLMHSALRDKKTGFEFGELTPDGN
jgi:hypothetical protein